MKYVILVAGDPYSEGERSGTGYRKLYAVSGRRKNRVVICGISDHAPVYGGTVRGRDCISISSIFDLFDHEGT